METGEGFFERAGGGNGNQDSCPFLNSANFVLPTGKVCLFGLWNLPRQAMGLYKYYELHCDTRIQVDVLIHTVYHLHRKLSELHLPWEWIVAFMLWWMTKIMKGCNLWLLQSFLPRLWNRSNPVLWSWGNRWFYEILCKIADMFNIKALMICCTFVCGYLFISRGGGNCSSFMLQRSNFSCG